jgi:hypothetical protein
MLAKLESAKILVSTLFALKNRWVKAAQLRDIAIAEDMENRQKLVDPTLSSEDFTKYSNQARAAQRRRANLHDRMIELEEAIREKAAELQAVGTTLVTAPFLMPKPELALVDEAALHDEEVTAEVFVDPEAEVEAEVVVVEEEAEAA